MATLLEFFEIDFRHTLKVKGENKYKIIQIEADVDGYLCFDYTSNSVFYSYYFRGNNLNVDFFINFLTEIQKNNSWLFAFERKTVNERIFDGDILLPKNSLLNGLYVGFGENDPLDIQAKYPGEEIINLKDLNSYGRIFLYSETQLSTYEIIELKDFAKTLNLNIQFRSKEFCDIRNNNEKTLAFISHDSKDKDSIARPLAQKLISNDCPVWYDEYSLDLGDNLRESIEKGIKKCDKCILILTPNFFKNNGWTKLEFNSIFTRQLIEEQKLILPIWCGIEKQEVYDYSPSLLNIVGVNWNIGIEKVKDKIITGISGRQL